MARIKVQDGYSDITDRCKATFTDYYGNTKQVLSLERSGYVFTQLEPGTTYLRRVVCDVVSYNMKDLDFEVAGPGLATYFGHVHFMRTEQAIVARERAERIRALSAIGGAAGGLIAGVVAVATAQNSHGDEGNPTTITVADRPLDLVANYRRKFQSELLVPMVYSLAGPAQIMPPTVILEGDTLVVDADLEGATITWLGAVVLADAGFTLRLRPAPGVSVAACERLEIKYDAAAVELPVTRHTDTANRLASEFVEAPIEAQLLQGVLDAKVVELKLCTLTRRLSYQATLAARRLLDAHRERKAELKEEPPSFRASAVDPAAHAGAAPATEGGAAEQPAAISQP